MSVTTRMAKAYFVAVCMNVPSAQLSPNPIVDRLIKRSEPGLRHGMLDRPHVRMLHHSPGEFGLAGTSGSDCGFEFRRTCRRSAVKSGGKPPHSENESSFDLVIRNPPVDVRFQHRQRHGAAA